MRRQVENIHPANLQWSSRSGGRAGIQEDCRLTINEEADLDVAVIYDKDSEITIVVCDEELRRQYRLPEKASYILTVEINGENGEHISSDFRLSIDPVGMPFKKDNGPVVFIPSRRDLPEMRFELIPK